MSIPAPRPACSLVMPFGTTVDTAGAGIDFDAIDRAIMRPAIEAAGLYYVRADGGPTGFTILEPLDERMVLCEYAVVDLTTADAVVHHHLGARRAVRPSTTVVVFAHGGRPPFELGPRGGLAYHLDGRGRPSAPEDDRRRLTELLVAVSRQANPLPDSPVFPLLEGTGRRAISRLKTDVFRDEVAYSAVRKEQLRSARELGRDAVAAVRDELGDLRHVEVGVVIDLLLSFRAVEAHADVVDLVETRMDPPAQRLTMVREQYAFALDRVGRSEDAERVLLDLIGERGPSSETYGLLGRVYKKRWDATHDGEHLQQAIDAYTKGFEADWRDAYPGVNAVELMELQDPPDQRRHELLPVVRYAAERRVHGSPDYWDHATLLVVAVLQRDEPAARRAVRQARAAMREAWEATSTLESLRRLRAAAEGRRAGEPWMLDVERELAAVVTPSRRPLEPGQP